MMDGVTIDLLSDKLSVELYAVASLAIGLLFLSFYILRLVFRRKMYMFKPVAYMGNRVKAASAILGFLFVLSGVTMFAGLASVSILIYAIIAVFGFVFLLSVFNYSKSGSGPEVSDEIQMEINTRYGIEDRLINKNKQLQWAERTAKICYVSWALKKDEIKFSDGAEDVFGIDAQNIYSFDDLKSLIIPEDRLRIQRFREGFADQKEMMYFQFRIILGNNLKYISMNCELYDNGTPYSMMRGTFQDVTEQQMFIKRIEDKNETLKNIAWTQSHEVRGPLASILGLIQLVNEEDFNNPENKEIIAGLKEASEQLDDIIKKIVKKAESVDVDLSQ